MRSEKKGFQTTQGPPQEVSRRPRTLQGLEVGANLAPRGVPKSIQNRSKSELASPQDPRPPRDPPKIPKWTPKWVPNRCEINFEIHSKFIQHRCEMRVQTLLEACRYASMQVCRYETSPQGRRPNAPRSSDHGLRMAQGTRRPSQDPQNRSQDPPQDLEIPRSNIEAENS